MWTMDGQRKAKCKGQDPNIAAINKCSSTYNGKGFPNPKKYENPGKYYPGNIGIELSVASRFQTSDNNFYNSKQPIVPVKNFYTTSQNFANKKTIEAEYPM